MVDGTEGVIAYVADYLVHFNNADLVMGYNPYHSPILYAIIGAFCIVDAIILTSR